MTEILTQGFKKDGLQKEVDFAIRLLRAIPTDDGPVGIAYSGGISASLELINKGE